MKKENKITLLVGLSYPVTFYFFWYLFKFNGWPWHSSYNIAGFFMLWLSEPWSSIAYDFRVVSGLSKLVGSPYNDYAISLFVCAAFVLNIFIVKSFFKWVYGKIKNTGN